MKLALWNSVRPMAEARVGGGGDDKRVARGLSERPVDEEIQQRFRKVEPRNEHRVTDVKQTLRDCAFHPWKHDTADLLTVVPSLSPRS
jgi:hypothetical protein